VCKCVCGEKKEEVNGKRAPLPNTVEKKAQGGGWAKNERVGSSATATPYM
jgi:hypothetical protein